MSPIAPALDRLCAEVAEITARHGRRIEPAALRVLDRQGQLQLDPPGRVSANRACRLVRAADGWIALNLAREEDQSLVPAWLRSEATDDAWAEIARLAPGRVANDLVEDGVMLGLPVARVGEVRCDSFAPPRMCHATPSPAPRRSPLRVVDLSALWAGPMCGAILAEMGASVLKAESKRRPDPTRNSTPEFFRRLNGRKSHVALDFGADEGRSRLRQEVITADILITSARPRAFAALGLAPETIFAANPSLVWVAITGYGWTGEAAERVAFGDDAAAAGGLVSWTTDGEPRFLGDALADPVTGLAAAVGALEALEAGGGLLVDVAMARCAAATAALCQLRAAA
jgi:hypothetical protein